MLDAHLEPPRKLHRLPCLIPAHEDRGADRLAGKLRGPWELQGLRVRPPALLRAVHELLPGSHHGRNPLLINRQRGQRNGEIARCHPLQRLGLTIGQAAEVLASLEVVWHRGEVVERECERACLGLEFEGGDDAVAAGGRLDGRECVGGADDHPRRALAGASAVLVEEPALALKVHAHDLTHPARAERGGHGAPAGLREERGVADEPQEAALDRRSRLVFAENEELVASLDHREPDGHRRVVRLPRVLDHRVIAGFAHNAHLRGPQVDALVVELPVEEPLVVPVRLRWGGHPERYVALRPTPGVAQDAAAVGGVLGGVSQLVVRHRVGDEHGLLHALALGGRRDERPAEVDVDRRRGWRGENEEGNGQCEDRARMHRRASRRRAC